MFEDQESTNPTRNPHFAVNLSAPMARRQALKWGGLGAAAWFLAGPLSGCASTNKGHAKLLGFKAVSASTADTVVVPEGYRAQVFVPWGTPLFSKGPGAHWKGDGSESAADQARQVGDNHDGMHFFPLSGTMSDEGLLVMNHEYTTVVKGQYMTLFGSPAAALSIDQVNKAINAWGCSVIHVRKSSQGEWQVVLDSPYNRRITANTPMQLSGPAAGSALLRTRADPTGRLVLGTLNNCGNGFTPWGTYLTCEENFNGNFGTSTGAQPDTRTTAQKRYGIPAGPSAYGWERHHARFDHRQEPHESNRFGWVVEIDPFDPQSIPIKRTALGRFKHESAAWTLSPDGRVVVYMGDDQADDYIYKFVSDQPFRVDQPQANRQLLDSGRLYVARFDPAANGKLGQGQWLLLDKTHNPTLKTDGRFADQAEVLIHARLAADLLGATPMDRPEWVTVHPQTGEVYCTLTNHAQRVQTNDANPRSQNIYGHIIRWREDRGDSAATTFEWDLFALAGNPTLSQNQNTPRAGSTNINSENTFNSPDGLAFDAHGRLWIETDGNYDNSGDFAQQGNNSLLCADPQSREIRRFMVGPKGCEITGIAFTPDHRTLFVNVQHPGEKGPGSSHWPEGAGALPRSATVVIQKEDGGVIGS
jgi:uncharacterized protein